jgi:hypothetical protein
MCHEPPPAGFIKLDAPLHPGDCVVTVLNQFLTIPDSYTSSVWLDHLYIKVDAPISVFQGVLDGSERATLVEHRGGSLYASNCTFDGHDHSLRAIDMLADPNNAPTKLYADGALWYHPQVAKKSEHSLKSTGLPRDGCMHAGINVYLESLVASIVLLLLLLLLLNSNKGRCGAVVL